MVNEIEKSRPLRFPSNQIFCAESDSKVIAPSEIQLLKVGFYEYWDDSKFTIDLKVFESFIKNFKENIRGVDLALDYSHNNHEKAAGWIKDIYIKNDTELWGKIEWTPKGKEKIEGKEFRYVSAEFCLEYKSQESGIEYGPTLYGAGLTNRPFVKGMMPTTLSENINGNKKGFKMEEKLEEVMVMLLAMKGQLESFGERLSALEERSKEKESLEEDGKKELEVEKELSEKGKAFDKLLCDGDVVEAQREFYLSGDAINFSLLSKKLNMKSSGHNEGKKKDNNLDCEDEIAKLASDYAEKNGVSFSEAVKEVMKNNKELTEKRNEKYLV